jgi:hypothetical protein
MNICGSLYQWTYIFIKLISVEWWGNIIIPRLVFLLFSTPNIFTLFDKSKLDFSVASIQHSASPTITNLIFVKHFYIFKSFQQNLLNLKWRRQKLLPGSWWSHTTILYFGWKTSGKVVKFWLLLIVLLVSYFMVLCYIYSMSVVTLPLYPGLYRGQPPISQLKPGASLCYWKSAHPFSYICRWQIELFHFLDVFQLGTFNEHYNRMNSVTICSSF